MPDNLNRIRNADFSAGKSAPSHWKWRATTGGGRWERIAVDSAVDRRTMTVVADNSGGVAGWSQVVGCAGGDYYRVDAVVRCDLSAADEQAGFVLTVEPLVSGQSCAERLVTPAVRRAEMPITIRTVFEAPRGIRRVRISVGIVGASGRADIEAVRFIPILEPDAISHVLAAPPPPSAYPPPHIARSICICSDVAADRPITGLLAEYFGRSKVRAQSPSQLKPNLVETDALLLPDPTPPAAIRSLATLKKLAGNRIVIISLPAFATLTRGAAALRRIEQPDDPIHAKVTFANHATRGFALDDVFPYAGEGSTPGSLVQNQYRKTQKLAEFCDKHCFTTLLTSMCEKNATSEQPICLHHSTPGGGLYVLDIEPMEAAGSTLGEPAIAMYLLLSILGQTQAGLGQFVVPVRKEAQFRELIREMSARFEQFHVHDADLPADEVTEQLVTIGREDQTFGLPLSPKPVILIRSGLTSGDVESIYGAFVWLKQLIRPEPYSCPYAAALASQYRLVWIPSASPWEWGDGWKRNARMPVATAIETDGGEVAALIDVTSRPINRVRVVLPRGDEMYRRCATWLPRLIRTFPPGTYFAPAVQEGDVFADRSRLSWRRVQHGVEVLSDDSAFPEEAHREVLAAGGRVVRLEVPGCDSDFVANSIQRTDLTATLLEQVIGVQYGLIAVNRQTSSVRFDGFRPVRAGEALLVEGDNPALQGEVSRAG